MADTFGLKIGLEGEKEFKKALSDINQSFKVLGSEMKLVQSQFSKNDNSAEALAARTKTLTSQIDAQKQKIEMLQKALQNASESFGEKMLLQRSTLIIRRLLQKTTDICSTASSWMASCPAVNCPTAARPWLLLPAIF